MPKFEVELKQLPGDEVCFAINVQGFLLPFVGRVLAVFPCCRNKSEFTERHEPEYLVSLPTGRFMRVLEGMISAPRQVVAMCQDQNEVKLDVEEKQSNASVSAQG